MRELLIHAIHTPQFDVDSQVTIKTATTSEFLRNANVTVALVPCPLPAFGASLATLVVTRNWNW